MHFTLKNTTFETTQSFFAALPQLFKSILFRVGSVCADYIINIYLILCTGVGYCEREREKAKIDNIKKTKHTEILTKECTQDAQKLLTGTTALCFV